LHRRAGWLLGALFAVACSTAQLIEAPPLPQKEEPTDPAPRDGGKDAKKPGVDPIEEEGGGDPSRPDGRVTVYVQPEDKAASILNAIHGAKTSIALEMYLLTGYRFQDALIAAKRRGVDVKVVLNKTFPGNFENGQGNTPAFDKLTAAGIPTVWAPPRFQYTHSKTAIVDGKEVWIMTMNMTVTSPTSNREFIVVDRDADDVAEAQQIFDADFEGRDVTVAGRLLVWPKDAAPVDARIRLVEFVAGAKKSVTIAGSDISDGEICRAIMSAKGRGLEVRVIFDGQTMNDGETRWANTFKEAGIDVRLMNDPDLHAKVILVDGERAYTGSINFTTNSLYDNREVGLIFGDASEVSKIATTLDKDWNAAAPF